MRAQSWLHAKGSYNDGSYSNMAATRPATPAYAMLETCRIEAGLSGMVGGEVAVGTTVGTRVETAPVPVGAAVLLPLKLVTVETRVKLIVLVRVSVDVMVVVMRLSWALTATRGSRSAAAIDLNCIVSDMGVLFSG